MKILLQSTSAQLLQALTEKEKAINDSQEAIRATEEVRRNAEVHESTMVDEFRTLEEGVAKTTGTVTALADSIEGFQRHVLPTFKPSANDISKVTRKLTNKPGGPTHFMASEVWIRSVFPWLYD